MDSVGHVAQSCLLYTIRSGVCVHVCKMFYLKVFVVSVNVQLIYFNLGTPSLYLSIFMIVII
jgi:hypothetical protein